MAEDAGNSMKQRLAAGELVLCMNLRLARTVDIAMVAKAGGYDALYVDMQHAPYSIETTSTICAAALGIGITPLVRVPSHDGHWMSRVLDGGAQGVIVPDLESRAQGEAVVRHCRFPPVGRRSVMGWDRRSATAPCRSANLIPGSTAGLQSLSCSKPQPASTMPKPSPRCRGLTSC